VNKEGGKNTSPAARRAFGIPTAKREGEATWLVVAMAVVT